MNELDAALNRIRGDGDDLTLIRRELDRLRAKLAVLQPLADAVVAYYCDLDADPDATALFETVREFGADLISRRAAAQQASL